MRRLPVRLRVRWHVQQRVENVRGGHDLNEVACATAHAAARAATTTKGGHLEALGQ